VIATGAWTSLIKVGNRPMPLTVKPIRGQIISFAPAERLFAHVIHSRRGYLVPRADGRILIGATVEEAGFDRNTTIAAENYLAEAAREFSPVFDELPISGSWAGLRPYAEGGMPIIGEVPGWSNLFVGTAHYRNGILLAPITAKVLARQILRVSDESNFGSYAATVRP
jgi:glycine oxidase